MMPARTALKGRRAILFDLDGTLYASDDYPSYCAELDRVTGLKVMELYGESSGEAAYARLEADRVRLAVRTRGEALKVCFGLELAEMNRHREAHTEPHRFLTEDRRLMQALETLAAEYRLLLGTNNTPLLARRVLRALGVDEGRFDLIVASEDVGAAKPDPHFFREIAKRSGFRFDEMVSVGDRPEVDLEPALALGMGAYAVKRMEDLYSLADHAATLRIERNSR